jgi:hypothetical protein
MVQGHGQQGVETVLLALRMETCWAVGLKKNEQGLNKGIKAKTRTPRE